MTTWPHDTPSAGKLTEQDLEAAIRASWPPRRTFHADGSAPAPEQVFVFGSNLSGYHGGGAARKCAAIAKATGSAT